MPTAGTCTAFVVFTHSVRSAVIDPSKFCKSDTQSWRAAWRRDQGYRVLGISYQHLNIWSIFLDISQKANTWCHQQARIKPDCALTSLAFRFCAAFMCALLALKAWHTPSRERLQTGSTKHPFNPNTKLPRAALVVAAWARPAPPAAPATLAITGHHRSMMDSAAWTQNMLKES